MRDDDGEENVPHSQNILIGVLVGSTRIISKERERKRLLSSVANLDTDGPDLTLEK